MLDARKAEDLGTLNPVPWAFILANCVGWLHYSFVTNNKYVFWSNAPGAVLGTFFTLTAVGLGTADQRRQIETVVVCSAGVHVARAGVLGARRGQRRGPGARREASRAASPSRRGRRV